MKYYLAIDIGASSGRHIIGYMENGTLRIDEVYRFPNGTGEINGHLTSDMEALLSHVQTGIKKALKKYPVIESLAIDTWGVDYVLLDHDHEILPVYAYRDHRTEAVIDKVHAIIPFETLYSHTGCQFQPFNTVYQLYADKEEGRLEKATDLLMLPEYLLWKLCGNKVREYTNATTSGMVNTDTKEYDPYIIDSLGYPAHLFPPLTQPGKTVGTYKGIRCVLCCTHDTASAVEGIPMDENSPYISSGTWSLLGVKTDYALTGKKDMEANYSNEGGPGYYRYQKNIMGMWPINRLKEELCPEDSFSSIMKQARESTCEVITDINAPEFLSPSSMKEAFDHQTDGALKSTADYFRCACLSLAQSYAKALKELEENTGHTYEKLYIVGGGANNTFLNALTEQATGKQVIALPIEATALGNLKIQMENTL